MKKIVSILLSVTMSVIFAAVPVRSQNGSAQDGDLLKARIERLESTDVKSKSITAQLIYKRSLLRLYNHYSAALEQEISDLRNIQKVVSDADINMRREIVARIQKLAGEREATAEKIETLTGDLRAGVTPGGSLDSAPVANPPDLAEPALGEQVSYTRTERPNVNTRAEEFSTATHTPEPANNRPPLNGASTPNLLPPQGSGSGSTSQTNNTPQDNVIEVDWGTRTAGCPARVTQASSRVRVHVTNVNNLLVDFEKGFRLEYRIRTKGSRVSAVPPENPFFTPQTAPFTDAKAIKTSADLETELNEIRREVKAPSRINRISPPQAGGPSIPWQTTLTAALEIGAVRRVINALAQNPNDPLFQIGDPVLDWVKLLRGGPDSHSFDFSLVLEPNTNYEFTLMEIWQDKATNGGTLRWDCGENDIFSLSVGPLITTLPSRTYSHQKAPVPPGSSTTQDILTVGNSTNLNVLGGALLNYHFPRARFLPGDMGLGLSVGPVYTLGGTPGVSALGLFAGPTIHLNRSIFLTPGIHIGEFADFPEGFVPGSVIPNQFGDLNPVKRRTAKFAIGITFKTNSFKKSTQTGGQAGNSATGGSGSGQGSGGTTQPTSSTTPGTTGTGGTAPQPTPQTFNR